MSLPGKSFDLFRRLAKAAETRSLENADERGSQIAQEVARSAAHENARRLAQFDTSGAQAVARRFKEQQEANLEQADLIRRTAVAVEQSAAAAADSKQGADAALMWARVAALISLAALLVSAWPYITEWWN